LRIKYTTRITEQGARTTEGYDLPDVLVAQLDGLRFAQLLAGHHFKLLVCERHFKDIYLFNFVFGYLNSARKRALFKMKEIFL